MQSVNNLQTSALNLESENLSLGDDKSDIRMGTKRSYERNRDSSLDLASISQSLGPTTRRKEQMLQSSGKNSNDKTLLELNTLKKFDDFYKEKKNLENEMYLYKPPRVNLNHYQISLEKFNNKCYNNKSYSITVEDKETIS
jgi:hypothetical protein